MWSRIAIKYNSGAIENACCFYISSYKIAKLHYMIASSVVTKIISIGPISALMHYYLILAATFSIYSFYLSQYHPLHAVYIHADN